VEHRSHGGIAGRADGIGGDALALNVVDRLDRPIGLDDEVSLK
jgi:hypothetical protein